MAVSEDNKALARYLRDASGGAPTVAKYWDDARTSNLDIMTIQDALADGVSTYATLGLSDAKTGLILGDKPLGVEIIFALATARAEGGNIIATSGFSIQKSEVIPAPGVIIPRVLELYGDARDMKHVMLIAPFLWDLKTQTFPNKAVAWLQATPISDAERDYVLKNGGEALEELFEKHQIDVFDIDRSSII